VTNNQFIQAALKLNGTISAPHFDRTAFKVTGKRSYATLHEPSHTCNIKLSPVDQSVFSDYGENVYPVPNKWGDQGWTTFELETLPAKFVEHALESAYNEVVGTK